jgi:flagellar motor switch protein FliG
MKKSIYNMNGIERAAAFLTVIGEEAASEIFKNLDDDSIIKLAEEMAKIKSLSAADKEDLIGEFYLALRDEASNEIGGPGKARRFLESAFGFEKANEIFYKLKIKNVGKEFDFFKEVDPEIAAMLMKDEMPQTIAVALFHLPPELAVQIMKAFPLELKKSVAVKLAKINKIAPDAALRIAEKLKERYLKQVQDGGQLAESGGIDNLAQILNYMSYSSERQLLKNLDEIVPDISNQVKNKIYSFDQILDLSNRDIRLLIDHVGSDKLIALALKGLGDDIRFKFFRNLSENRAKDMLEEIKILGMIRASEVEEARDYIIQTMRRLDESGLISIKREGETYVL